jgi:hypothetical protein
MLVVVFLRAERPEPACLDQARKRPTFTCKHQFLKRKDMRNLTCVTGINIILKSRGELAKFQQFLDTVGEVTLVFNVTRGTKRADK